jgi:NAD(P)-dependent dehydrogenase (short-subunit alcohol dehydrogenase family)
MFENLFRLDGKVAVVTGAGNGLGRSFALGLAAFGATVICADRNLDGADETASLAKQSRGKAETVPVDVADETSVDAMWRTIADTHGRVDILINNAGVGTAVPATRETPDEFRRVIDINLNGSYFMAQACGRAMRDKGGSIVNIGSVLGSTSAMLPQAAYASSKAAIIGLTRDLAQQWTGRKKIRVNALAPGFFESEMTGQYPEGYLDQMMFRVPAGRKGEAHELVAAALFLASDASSYVTGVVLPVDGGMLTT